jgi:hypothetical protein
MKPPLPRITASALYDLYMCPAKVNFERPDNNLYQEARDYGHRAHKYWETGEHADEFDFWRPTGSLREVQVWYDHMSGRTGARLARSERDYSDLPPHVLAGTIDACRRDGETLYVADLKTGKRGRDGKFRPKDTAKDNHQLIFLAGCLYYLARPKDRPACIILEIFNAPKGEPEPVSSVESYGLGGDYGMNAFVGRFHQFVSNPLAKILRAYQEPDHHAFTNPGSHCIICTAVGCESRKQTKQKK